MDSVDYTKQLSRKNELFQRDLQNANKAHKSNLESVKETAENKVQKQSNSHLKDRQNLEKSFKDNVDSLRSSQAESLAEKNKAYEKSVESQKSQFHDERKSNLKEWNEKFSGLKDSFRKELANRENVDDSQKLNNAKNIQAVQDKSEKAISEHKKQMQENAVELKESYNKERVDIANRHASEKKDLLDNGLEKQNRFREHTAEQMAKVKKHQEQSIISQREGAEERFDKFSKERNAKQKDFSQNELARVKEAAVKGIEDKNRQFAKRYADLDHAYNKDVRDIQRRVQAEKVTSGDTRKAYDEKLRTNEKIQHDQRRQTLLDQNVSNTKFYNNKMTELKELQQDELHQERIRNAGEISKREEAQTLALQDKDFKAKVTQDRASHNSTVRLNQERSENTLQRSRLENHKNTEINNLKLKFRDGIEKAALATREGMEEVKQEGVMEKRQLEKRLREQNSDTTAQLKEFHNSKFETMKANLETEIMNLKNQNEAIQRNAVDMVNNIRTQSQADLERQIQSSERKLSDLVAAERNNSRVKELSLKKTLRESEANFRKKMNEMTHENQKQMKQLATNLTTQGKEDVAKQQEENQIQKRYFTREIERLKSSSTEERQALITQYEDRMKQMQEVYAQKLSEIKNFNTLENA